MSHRYQQYLDFWSRDEHGLLKNIDYVFKEDEPGRIDWVKMIPDKFFVPNRDKFPEGTDFSKLKIKEVEDNKKLILLGGFKYILPIRGYTSVYQKIVASTPEYASTVCEIELIPSPETNNGILTFTGEADANLNNTHSFARDYLVAISSNRSFVRAVRNALRIDVLGSDEIGPQKQNGNNSNQNSSSESGLSPVGPQAVLEKTIAKKGKTFEALKKRLIKDDDFIQSVNSEKYPINADIINSWENEGAIPPQIVVQILGWLKNVK